MDAIKRWRGVGERPAYAGWFFTENQCSIPGLFVTRVCELSVACFEIGLGGGRSGPFPGVLGVGDEGLGTARRGGIYPVVQRVLVGPSGGETDAMRRIRARTLGGDFDQSRASRFGATYAERVGMAVEEAGRSAPASCSRR